MHDFWPGVITKSKGKTAFNDTAACNIDTKQWNFWFISCDAILQLSHRDMVVLHNNKPVST